MLEAGENDRYDHVRTREAALAREAQKIAVGVANMRLVSWRCRTEHDWLALAERCSSPSEEISVFAAVDASRGRKRERDASFMDSEELLTRMREF